MLGCLERVSRLSPPETRSSLETAFLRTIISKWIFFIFVCVLGHCLEIEPKELGSHVRKSEDESLAIISSLYLDFVKKVQMIFRNVLLMMGFDDMETWFDFQETERSKMGKFNLKI